MRMSHLAAAALVALLPVGAAQSSVDATVPSSPIKGWPAVAGLSGADVLELARSLPATTEGDAGQPWCDDAAAVQASLDGDFDERLVMARGDGTQLWGSDLMGTWTVVLARTDRTNCIIASGIGYQDGANPAAFYAKVGLAG